MVGEKDEVTERCKVSAIILAAGQARRMGELKQLLPWQGSTIIERVVDSVVASGVTETIVVVGYRGQEVAQRLAGKPVKIKTNVNYKGGMSSSLICGLEALDSKSTGIMIVLGDQPALEVETLKRLISVFCQRSAIIVPVYQKRRGNPVIFPSSYVREMLSLEGDRGAKSVIEAHPDDIIEIEVSTDSVIRDIDNTDDYRDLRSRYSPGKP